VATQIVATRKERSVGADHVHVAAVKTLDGRVFARSELVSRTLNGWESFYTEYGRGRARVFARFCEGCTVYYATTKPDPTIHNILLNLPDF
jgi:hypothetical protein